MYMYRIADASVAYLNQIVDDDTMEHEDTQRVVRELLTELRFLGLDQEARHVLEQAIFLQVFEEGKTWPTERGPR